MDFERKILKGLQARLRTTEDSIQCEMILLEIEFYLDRIRSSVPIEYKEPKMFIPKSVDRPLLCSTNAELDAMGGVGIVNVIPRDLIVPSLKGSYSKGFVPGK